MRHIGLRPRRESEVVAARKANNHRPPDELIGAAVPARAPRDDRDYKTGMRYR